MAKGGNGGGNSGGGGKPGGDSEWNQVNGNKRDNELFGTDGIKNAMLGKDGNDILHGGDLEDLLIGGNGDDILYGNDGPDRLHGGNGNDELYGGEGDDSLQGGAGIDLLDGGPGFDIAIYTENPGPNGVTVNANDIGGGSVDYTILFFGGGSETTENIEGVVGSNYNDDMNGDTSDDWFSGAYGDDVIDGGDGADILDGGPDNDTIDGGDGGDMIYGGSGNDTLNGDDGDDFLHGESGDDDMTGGAGADTFLFLRNATDDEDPDTDPDPIFGHGNDVIWDYDPLEDELHFLTNEDFVPQLSDDSGNTTVTYADDSSIVLMNIVIDDLLDLNATVIVDPDLFTV